MGFFIADALFTQFPQLHEGDLTRMRARLVRQSTLASIARDFDLGAYLLMGVGELKSGGYKRDSVLSNALEAIIGAMYLDSDIAQVNLFLQKIYTDLLKEIHPKNLKDNKTQLQELLQKHDQRLPVYTVLDQQGEDHSLTFKVSCSLPDKDQEFIGFGTSRKIAEQNAAEQALSSWLKQS